MRIQVVSVSDEGLDADRADDVAADTLSWRDGIVFFRRARAGFRVEFADAGERGTYCRPAVPYDAAEFEQLFGFGVRCRGFTLNRVMLLAGVRPRETLMR